MQTDTYNTIITAINDCTSIADIVQCTKTINTITVDKDTIAFFYNLINKKFYEINNTINICVFNAENFEIYNKIKIAFESNILTSRLQATRIINQLIDIESIVVIDFCNIIRIEPEFADELFRVFKSKNNKVTIHPTNTTEAIENMISYVERN